MAPAPLARLPEDGARAPAPRTAGRARLRDCALRTAARALGLALLVLAAGACGGPEGGAGAEGAPAQASPSAPDASAPAPGAAATPAPGARSLVAEIGGQLFLLEVASDPEARFRGLSGRCALAPDRGMLFVYPAPGRRGAVMRDCAAALDLAFLDDDGRIVRAVTMRPEPPRRADETPGEYEARLPPYWSARPVRFVLELAGGRLAELGLGPGDRVAFDLAAARRGAR